MEGFLPANRRAQSLQDASSLFDLRKTRFFTRRFLWILFQNGPKAVVSKMCDILTCQALILAFFGTFGNSDVSDRVFDPSYMLSPSSSQWASVVQFLAWAGPATQLLSCCGIVLCVLMHIQLNFYDNKNPYEIAFFVQRFGWMFLVVTIVLIATVLLIVLSLNGRCYLYFYSTSAVWITSITATIVLSLPLMLLVAFLEYYQYQLRLDAYVPPHDPEGDHTWTVAKERILYPDEGPLVFENLLSDSAIQQAPYATKLFLWSVKGRGAKQTCKAMRNLVMNQAILLTFIAAFVNNDVPERVFNNMSHNRPAIVVLAIASPMAQVIACSGILLSIVLYIQLGFYNFDSPLEASVFFTKFGKLTSAVTTSLIVAVLFLIIAFDTRIYLLYNSYSGVWGSIWAISGAISIFCISMFPYMSLRMRRLREQQTPTDDDVKAATATMTKNHVVIDALKQCRHHEICATHRRRKLVAAHWPVEPDQSSEELLKDEAIVLQRNYRKRDLLIPDELLSNESINKANYAARLFLWSLRAFESPKRIASILGDFLLCHALILAFVAAFVNKSLPDRVFSDDLNRASVLTFLGIAEPVAQMLACLGVIFSLVLYVQLSFFYDHCLKEIALFLHKFGSMTSFATTFLIASVALFIASVGARAYLLFNDLPEVWITIWIACVVLSLCVAASFPFISLQTRRLRANIFESELSISAPTHYHP